MSESNCPYCGLPKLCCLEPEPVLSDLWERIRHSPVIDPAYRGSLDEMNEQGVKDILEFLEMLR